MALARAMGIGEGIAFVYVKPYVLSPISILLESLLWLIHDNW